MLRPALFKTVPTAPMASPAPGTKEVAMADLRMQRARLSEMSQYRMTIISNDRVPSARVPLTMAQINSMIAAQRAIVKGAEDAARALGGP